jgi:hypothetical protein
MRARDNTLRRGERKREFDRYRLPAVADYYRPVFGDLRFNASGWAQGAASSTKTDTRA